MSYQVCDQILRQRAHYNICNKEQVAAMEGWGVGKESSNVSLVLNLVHSLVYISRAYHLVFVFGEHEEISSLLIVNWSKIT